MVRSTTYDAGDPGSNPALGTQGIVTLWMLTPHYDAFRCSLMLTFATKKLSTVQKGQKAEADFPFCPRSFDRAFIAAQWYDLRDRDVGDPGSNPALGKQAVT